MAERREGSDALGLHVQELNRAPSLWWDNIVGKRCVQRSYDMFRTSAYGPLWGALFTLLLLAGCVTDVRSRRIPNVLVAVILVTGVAYSLSSYPLTVALVSSASGFALGFAIWIGFWLLGLLGAGDVKFFAAAGAWLGPGAVWRAALIAGIVGGVLAAIALIRDRRLKSGLQRTALAVASRSFGVMGSATRDEGGGKRHLPYGVALAAGALAAAWIPTLLA